MTSMMKGHASNLSFVLLGLRGVVVSVGVDYSEGFLSWMTSLPGVKLVISCVEERSRPIYLTLPWLRVKQASPRR